MISFVIHIFNQILKLTSFVGPSTKKDVPAKLIEYLFAQKQVPITTPPEYSFQEIYNTYTQTLRQQQQFQQRQALLPQTGLQMNKGSQEMQKISSLFQMELTNFNLTAEKFVESIWDTQSQLVTTPSCSTDTSSSQQITGLKTTSSLSQVLFKMNKADPSDVSMEIYSSSDFYILQFLMQTHNFENPDIQQNMQYHLVFLSSQLENFTNFKPRRALYPFLLKEEKLHHQENFGFESKSLREVVLLRRLHHPHILPLLKVWTQPRISSVVVTDSSLLFPFYPNTLYLWRKSFETVSQQTFLRIARQLLEVLEYLHNDNRKGAKYSVIHRNLHPDSIWVAVQSGYPYEEEKERLIKSERYWNESDIQIYKEILQNEWEKKMEKNK